MYRQDHPLADLRPHPRNYRAHPPDQLTHLARSLEEHGVYRNVVATRDGTILAGHGVVAAARQLGWATIPVVVLDLDPEDPRARKLLVADNELSNLAEVDDRELTELLRELADDEGVEALLGTGYDELSLAALAMATRSREELADWSAAGEWIGLPGFEAATQEPRLLIRCGSEEDRAALLEELGQLTVHYRMGNIWTVWWPDRPRADRVSVRFQPAEQ